MGQTFEVDEQVGGSRHALEPLNVLIYCTCSACMLYIKFLSFFVKKVEGTASLHLLFLLKDSNFEQTFRISDSLPPYTHFPVHANASVVEIHFKPVEFLSIKASEF
jgi:hypothetical protein